ncbi:MAG: hypothetical protein KGI67_09095, partial [Pseudomonadota bacterium]|nr:hypothetical protein [Pseudomonadota bacterium]
MSLWTRMGSWGGKRPDQDQTGLSKAHHHSILRAPVSQKICLGHAVSEVEHILRGLQKLTAVVGPSAVRHTGR